MLILPVAWDQNGKPTLFDSGRVFTHVRGVRGFGAVRVFVGTYRESSVAEVIRMAYLNARVVQMRYALSHKMTVGARALTT